MSSSLDGGGGHIFGRLLLARWKFDDTAKARQRALALSALWLIRKNFARACARARTRARRHSPTAAVGNSRTLTNLLVEARCREAAAAENAKSIEVKNVNVHIEA